MSDEHVHDIRGQARHEQARENDLAIQWTNYLNDNVSMYLDK